MSRILAVCLFLLPGCGSETETGFALTLRALTYNIHGLPPEITNDDTAARIAAIAPLLNAYDLVGLQEDFDDDDHAVLSDASEHSQKRRFADILPDRVYGSGLAVFSDFEESTFHHEHYETCHGILESASDCLASKGFQVIRLVLGEGLEVDVYNSHLEAGGGEEDNASREAQVLQILARMEAFSEARAMLLLADTNLHAEDEQDAPLLDLFYEAGLEDACTAVDCAEPNRIDRVLFRSGGDLILEVTDWRVDPDFSDAEGIPLSDHDPISVSLRARSVEEAGR